MRLLSVLPVVLVASCFEGTADSAGGAGGDGDWLVEGLTLQRNSLNYAEVAGRVTLQGAYAGGGTQAEVRYYSDDYATVIIGTSAAIGQSLEAAGETQSFEITHYSVYVVPATGGYERVCAEIRVTDSNISNWTPVGCLE